MMFYKYYKKFRIDYVGNQGRKAYVFATQFEESNFKVTDSSFLGEIPIHPSLSQPRELKKNGTPDYDTFVFTLRFKQDKDQFKIGDIVKLEEKDRNLSPINPSFEPACC